jgi:L,D-peptidoglycan transpeptidase YkuD (ErfK/YbiS/YcfS/YnhG family)
VVTVGQAVGGRAATEHFRAVGGSARAASPVVAATATAPATQAPVVVAVPAPTTTSRPTGTAGGSSGAACDVGSADAQQVVVVDSSGTRASVEACSRTREGTYVRDLGPYSGYVGRSGVSSAASKREGDGATPAGVYPLRSGFGIKADPGLAQGWDRVDSSDVWVDDPDSSLYNTQQRLPADGRWSSAETLANAPAYNYAQVIGYNESATPGRGSAIFLHVSTGGPTAGCVSVSTSALLGLMRWQESGALIAIR